MVEIPEVTNPEELSSAVAAVRAEFFSGLTDVPTLAAVLDRTPRQIHEYIKQGMPTVYYGSTAYPIIKEAKAWLMSRKTIS
jgi:hypothetical protein